VILVDAGPLIAAANRKDRHHDRCVHTLLDAQPPRPVSGLVIAEVCYMLARDGGAAQEAAFLRSFGTGFLTAAELTSADLVRSAELVEQYADLPLAVPTPPSLPSPSASASLRWPHSTRATSESFERSTWLHSPPCPMTHPAGRHEIHRGRTVGVPCYERSRSQRPTTIEQRKPTSDDVQAHKEPRPQGSRRASNLARRPSGGSLASILA